jgi:hypothetical protein
MYLKNLVPATAIDLIVFFFFQKKKQKAFVLLRRRFLEAHNSAKPTQGVWGRAPKELGIS